MRYTYTGKLENDEAGQFIDIPFNIWEICEKEGSVPAKVKIDDNLTFVCNLFPKGKGFYRIPVQPEVAEKIASDSEHKVSFRITKSGVDDSPYSTANPIRKIDHIECIHQPADGLCG